MKCRQVIPKSRKLRLAAVGEHGRNAHGRFREAESGTGQIDLEVAACAGKASAPVASMNSNSGKLPFGPYEPEYTSQYDLDLRSRQYVTSASLGIWGHLAQVDWTHCASYPLAGMPPA